MGFRHPGPLCRAFNPHIPPNDPGTLSVGATSAPRPTGLAHASPRRAHLPMDSVHGTDQPDKDMREGVKNLRETQQGVSQSYIVGDQGTKLQWEDREDLVAKIYFATGQSTIDAQDKTALRKVYNSYAKLLEGPALRAERPRVRFKFVGYADERGTERDNLDLSGKRATAVAEYFAPLRRSPHYGQGIVALGEAEKPQSVIPGAGSVSTQLSRYRRVDVFARPVLTKVPAPPPGVVPPDPGSRYWAIRLIDSAGGSIAVVGGTIARLEMVDMTHQTGMTFLYKAIGGSLGAKLSASMDSSPWVYVTTPQSLTFDDFEGHASHIGEGVGLVYGYSVDRFVFLGPMRKGAQSVAVKFTGWGRQVALGIAVEGRGAVSKRFGPYPVSPEYLAAPPSGTEIR